MNPTREIIVVEDEVIIALDIEAELKGRGFPVAGVAHNTEDAMRLLENDNVGAAILDVTLKSEKSYEVARACQAKGIQIVFLTGDSGATLPDDLRNVPILQKPVRLENLIQEVERVLRSAA